MLPKKLKIQKRGKHYWFYVVKGEALHGRGRIGKEEGLEICHRYNNFEELLAACKAMLDPSNTSNGMPLPHLWEDMKQAIANAEKKNA